MQCWPAAQSCCRCAPASWPCTRWQHRFCSRRFRRRRRRCCCWTPALFAAVRRDTVRRHCAVRAGTHQYFAERGLSTAIGAHDSVCLALPQRQAHAPQNLLAPHHACLQGFYNRMVSNRELHYNSTVSPCCSIRLHPCAVSGCRPSCTPVGCCAKERSEHAVHHWHAIQWTSPCTALYWHMRHPPDRAPSWFHMRCKQLLRRAIKARHLYRNLQDNGALVHHKPTE